MLSLSKYSTISKVRVHGLILYFGADCGIGRLLEVSVGKVKFSETAALTGLYKLPYMVLFSLYKEDRFPGEIMFIFRHRECSRGPSVARALGIS